MNASSSSAGAGANSASSSGADELSFTTLTAAAATATAPSQGAGEADGADGSFLLDPRRDSQDLDGDGDGETPHELREQDRFLPIANVARIMKKSIPSTQGKIAKDARECVQECVSEFISFITSEASDRCQAEKRKTINGEDILFAMSTLGFDNYVEPLKLYLQKYRETTKGDKASGVGAGPEGEFVDGMVSEEAFGNIQGIGGDQSGGGGGGGGQVLLTYPQQFA